MADDQMTRHVEAMNRLRRTRNQCIVNTTLTVVSITMAILALTVSPPLGGMAVMMMIWSSYMWGSFKS